MAAPQITTRYTKSADRPDYWRAAISRVFAPCRTHVVGAFRGAIASQSTGPISSHLVTASRHRALRSKDDVVQYSSEFVALSLMVSGVQQIVQDGREIELQKGDFALHDLARPYCLHFETDFSQYIFQIPCRMLRCRLGAFECFNACKLSSTHSLGSLAYAFFLGLAGIDDTVDPVKGERLAEQAVELLAMAIDEQVDSARVCGSPHRVALLYRAKLFLEDHLREGPRTADVAHYLGCSPRYVNSLFADEDASVRQYILTRRLQRCRDELAMTAGPARRISDVAYAWGFNSVAHFSRAFRAYYGVSPSECRSH